MFIKNLTPHAIVLVSPAGGNNTIPPFAPKGEEARVDNEPGSLNNSEELSTMVLDADPDIVGEVINLPDEEEKVIIIVSGMVGEALRSKGILRRDVRVPGTGPKDGAIREPALLPDGGKNPRAGQVTAVTRLKRIC